MNQQIKLRIKRIFTNNIGLKILALFGAVFLWLVVVNVDDPMQTKNFTVAVSVTNAGMLEENGKYYTIVDGNNTVSFKATARRSVMERISDSDFVAVADMNYMEDESRIPVSISYRGNSNNVTVSAKKLYLYVEVGTQSNKSFDISVETTGNVSDGHVIAGTTVDTETVSVSGPSDTINSIAKVVAYLDVTDASEDIEKTSSLHLLDKAGHEIDYSELEMDVSAVKCAADILTKKRIPITFRTSGNLAPGLTLESITFNPESVDIMGESGAVNEISSVEVSGALLNLTDITENKTEPIDISEYLPETVRIATGASSQVDMTIAISGEVSTTLSVPAANIRLENVEEGHSATVEDSSVNLVVTGDAKTVNAITSSGVTGAVDVAGLEDGTHELRVKWNLDDSAVRIEDVTVNVKVEITEQSVEE